MDSVFQMLNFAIKRMDVLITLHSNVKQDYVLSTKLVVINLPK